MSKSSSKPASLYELTEAGEELFAKAPGPVLRQILEELNERMSASEVEEVLRATGRRLVAQWPIPRGELPTRLEAAVSVFNELGGLAKLERRNDASVIRGYSCPLATMGQDHPEVCHLVESLLTEIVGVKVEEQSDRNKKVSCRFVVSAN